MVNILDFGFASEERYHKEAFGEIKRNICYNFSYDFTHPSIPSREGRYWFVLLKNLILVTIFPLLGGSLTLQSFGDVAVRGGFYFINFNFYFIQYPIQVVFYIQVTESNHVHAQRFQLA